MAWPRKQQPFGPNGAPLLAGSASDNTGDSVPVAVDAGTGSIYVGSSATPGAWDYMSANVSGSTTDVYTCKVGGSSGTTVATVTYTDSSKTIISTVVRT